MHRENTLQFEVTTLFPVGTILFSDKWNYRKIKTWKPQPKRMQQEREEQPPAKRNELGAARQQKATSISSRIENRDGEKFDSIFHARLDVMNQISLTVAKILAPAETYAIICATFHVLSSSINSVVKSSVYDRHPSTKAALYLFASGSPL